MVVDYILLGRFLFGIFYLLKYILEGIFDITGNIFGGSNATTVAQGKVTGDTRVIVYSSSVTVNGNIYGGSNGIIDGTSIKDLTRANIHDLFTMVLQDTWLFEGTIKENIVYNRKNITDSRISDSAI